MMAAVVERSVPVDDLGVVRRVGEPADELTWLRADQVAGQVRDGQAPEGTVLLGVVLVADAPGGDTDGVAVGPNDMVEGCSP